MCHMPPKKIFKKSQNFEFFQKRGFRESKNENFEKIFSKLKRDSKIGYKTCATCPQKRFSKKVKILSFFKKGGLRGSKNDFFEKIFPKSKRASKIAYETCATLPK